MKCFLTLLIAMGFLSSTNFLTAQSNVGIGTSTPNNKAILELSSSNKVLLLPRVHDTTSINNANGGIAANVAGMIAYDSSQKGVTLYDGEKWQLINHFSNSAESTAIQTLPFSCISGAAEISIPGLEINLPETGNYLALVRYFLKPAGTGEVAFYYSSAINGTISEFLETYAYNSTFVSGNMCLFASGSKGQTFSIKIRIAPGKVGLGLNDTSLFFRNNIRLIRLQ